MKFYNPKGEMINSVDEAVKFYSNIYYALIDIENANMESKIEAIYDKGIQADVEDFVTFLRWKVGDRKMDNDNITTNRGRKIEVGIIKRLACEIKSSNHNFEGNLGIEDAKSIYTYIQGFNGGVSYVGTVYTLALVSMVTKGQFPIYDKFADVGLKAASEGYKIRTVVEYKDMPDKRSVNSVIKRYLEYMDRLTNEFGNKWREERDIDRALWAYGHLFEVK